MAVLKIRSDHNSYLLGVPRCFAKHLGWTVGDEVAMRYEFGKLRVVLLIPKECKEFSYDIPKPPLGFTGFSNLRMKGNSISFTLLKRVVPEEWERSNALAVWCEDKELIATRAEDLYLPCTRPKREIPHLKTLKWGIYR